MPIPPNLLQDDTRRAFHALKPFFPIPIPIAIAGITA